MTTKCNQRRRALLIPKGLLLALLLSGFSDIEAGDRPANSKVVECTVKKNLPKNEDPIESDTTRYNVPMVGPSAQEIHDFLYPVPEDVKVVRPAN